MKLLLSCLIICNAGFSQTVNVNGNVAINGDVAIGPQHAIYMFFIGQSLARGFAPSISTTQPFGNRMWNGGMLSTGETNTSEALAGFIPLVEAIKETPASGFANQLRQWAGPGWDSIVGNWARNGACYSAIEKGGTGSNYVLSIASVSNVAWRFSRVNVPALLSIHGECDGPDAYEAKCLDWQADYETDIKALTGQSGIIPIFQSQPQNRDATSNDGMLAAHENNPTKTILVCPKYQFDYDTGGTHPTNYAYITIGEYYAKAFYKQIVLGQQYHPLRPLTITNIGAVISIQMTGMVGNLVFDTNFVGYQTNYGFEYIDGNASPPTISTVAITDAAAGKVQITLTGTPAVGGFKRIAYAMTGSPTGRFTGVRGNLRDSDPTIGRDGTNLWNWCVHFYKTINYP